MLYSFFSLNKFKLFIPIGFLLALIAIDENMLDTLNAHLSMSEFFFLKTDNHYSETQVAKSQPIVKTLCKTVAIQAMPPFGIEKAVQHSYSPEIPIEMTPSEITNSASITRQLDLVKKNNEYLCKQVNILSPKQLSHNFIDS